MRKFLFCFLLATGAAACDQMPISGAGQRARLSESEFVEVYVKLARAPAPEQKAAILKQHGTSQEELEEFVRVHLRDLPTLSTVFDTVVARMGSESPSSVPPLPIR